MVMAVKTFALNAYQMLLAKLRWLRERYRKDNRAGEFWARARHKVCGKVWVKAQVHWFQDYSTVLPAALEFKIARWGEMSGALESFVPATAETELPMLPAPPGLAQSIEVA